jgi:hypothetical protein
MQNRVRRGGNRIRAKASNPRLAKWGEIAQSNCMNKMAMMICDRDCCAAMMADYEIFLTSNFPFVTHPFSRTQRGSNAC